jgi:hypothetical protein
MNLERVGWVRLRGLHRLCMESFDRPGRVNFYSRLDYTLMLCYYK